MHCNCLTFFYIDRSEDEDGDTDKKPTATKTTMDNNKKKKISDKADEGVNSEIVQKDNRKKGNNNANGETAHTDDRKDKINKRRPVKKSTGKSNNQDAMSKGFIVEKISAATDNFSIKKKETILSTNNTKQKKTLAATLQQTPKSKTKKSNAKSNLAGVTKKIVKPQKSNNSTSTFSKKPTISDERLRAFGLNPKKFHKKLKYGAKSTSSETVINSKKVVSKTNKLDKLNQKKIKRKLLTVLGK